MAASSINAPTDWPAWVRLADDDLGTVVLLIRQRRYPTQACYHAQQATGKYLKAVLSWAGQPFPRTHDLARLYQLYPLTRVTYRLRLQELMALTPYGTDGRYPGLTTPPTIDEARRAVLMAGRVRRASRGRLGLS
jgi:HEPN domain-containing protein